MVTKRGKKTIYDRPRHNIYPIIIGKRMKYYKENPDERDPTQSKPTDEYFIKIEKDKALDHMHKIPKLQSFLAVAKICKQRGEKLIVFDINQSYIPFLYEFFSSAGFDTYPFCTAYNPAQRSKLLDDFRAKGDILIGSIAMLSESHNLSEANNLIFVRYPNKKEEFMQAFGRCHRYPQKKTVNIHMISSCSLELELALFAMKTSKTTITSILFKKQIAEFSNFLKTQISEPILEYDPEAELIKYV